MKPMSLATTTAPLRTAPNIGHQANHVIEVGVPRDMPRNITPDITNAVTMPVPNAITNQGMIPTKRIVFNVARFALREVMPIHIPNQQKAARLAAVLSAVAIAAAMPALTCMAVLRVDIGRGRRVGAEFVPALPQGVIVVLTTVVWLLIVPFWLVTAELVIVAA